MQTSSSVRKPVMGRLLASAALLLVAVPSAALAQAAPAAKPVDMAAKEETASEIIVTGSRIARGITDELFPTFDITAADVRNRGFFNVGEAIINNPLFSSLSNTDTDFNQSRQDIGFTFVNLFGLGSERTLTLVNGKRVVSSMSPQPNRAAGQSGLQVDIGTIPTALIERVETITVGGAPAYGADAIAGTVNLILKKRFEGLEVDGQTGLTDQGDGANYRVQAVFGTNFAGDRGNIIFTGEYALREGLAQTNRPGANDIQLSDVRLATSPAAFFAIVPQPPLNTFQRNTGFPGMSAFGTPARDLLGLGTAAVFGTTPVGFATTPAGQTMVFDDRGNLIPVTLGAGNGTFLFTQDQPEFPGLYREQNFVSLQNQSERFVVSSLGRFDFSDRVAATFRVNYSDLKARQLTGRPITLGIAGAPAPIVSINNPFLQPASRAILQTAGAGFGLPLLNNNSFALGKSLTEFGANGAEASSTTFGATAGLEGNFDVGERAFTWDVTYSYGKTKSNSRVQGVNRTLFTAAIDAVIVDSTGTIVTNPALFAAPSAFNFGSNGYTAANGQRIVCRSSVGTTGSACLPFNLFGAQNPQAVLDAVAFDSIVNAEVQQQFVQANLSGSAFDLPAGAVKFAIGAEYRDEQAKYSTDPITAVAGGLGQAGAITAIAAGFKSREAYGEVVVPLLSGEMLGTDFLDRVAFEGSARYIDNSIAGSDWVWTAGGRASFLDSVTIRGNKTRSVRAPAIGQIAGESPTFAGVSDPCSVSQITRGPAAATRRANCTTAVIAAGLATDTASATSFLTRFTGAVGGIPGVVGGNGNLENEQADSWTVGAVINPSFFRNLSLSVDWNAIKIDGAIQSLTGAQVISQCYDSTAFPTQPSCANFTRTNSTFNLASFRAGFVNTGFIDFAALTAAAQLRVPLKGDRHGISFSGTWFMLDRYREQAANGVVVEARNTVGYEKNRLQGQLGYSNSGMTILWTTTYTPSAFLNADERDRTANVFAVDKTSPSWMHDLSLLYELDKQFALRFVVTNLTNDQQPEELRQFGSVQSRIGRAFNFGITARY